MKPAPGAKDNKHAYDNPMFQDDSAVEAKDTSAQDAEKGNNLRFVFLLFYPHHLKYHIPITGHSSAKQTHGCFDFGVDVNRRGEPFI